MRNGHSPQSADNSEPAPPKRIGYARVSTADQNLDMQIEALKRYGVREELIFTDKASGGGSVKRKGFIRAMKMCQRPGTELVVWKLDRLGRTLTGILDILKRLETEGVTFVSLTEKLDTSTPMGKAMMQICGVMAELERNLTIERTREGLKRARERGEGLGRAPCMTPERIARAKELIAEGLDNLQILPALQKMKGPNLSRSAYYAWRKTYAEELAKKADRSELKEIQ